MIAGTSISDSVLVKVVVLVEVEDAELANDVWSGRELVFSEDSRRGSWSLRGGEGQHHWLHTMAMCGLQESELNFALKMRTNTVPTSSMKRRDGTEARQCCLCKNGLDTLQHGVGRWTAVKSNSMKNHNKICAILAKEGEDGGWLLWRERRLRTSDGIVGFRTSLWWKALKVIIFHTAWTAYQQVFYNWMLRIICCCQLDHKTLHMQSTREGYIEHYSFRLKATDQGVEIDK